jgi:hypothetical protein
MLNKLLFVTFCDRLSIMSCPDLINAAHQTQNGHQILDNRKKIIFHRPIGIGRQITRSTALSRLHLFIFH